MADAPLSSVLNWGDVGAAMPEAYGANAPVMYPLAKALIASATLPKRLMDTAAQDYATGEYHPGPYLEAAMLPMGTGAVAGVPLRAGEFVLGAGPIRAYHGSPHDFDAFDASKIGMGEGAQSYGHGLYFAENPKVAEDYADKLGKPNISNDDLVSGNYDLGPAGHRYEVNINADPEHFLDYDKPLNQQVPEVQDALKKAMGAGWDDYKYADASTAVRKGLIAFRDETVAKKLNEAGIPGIKYLDQGSRGAGQGSSNYVVFDDKLIDIMRKYGMIGAIPAAGAGFGGLAEQGQPKS